MESKSPSANPYLEARREWDERYGDALSRAHHWRLAAFAALSLAGVAVLGVAYVCRRWVRIDQPCWFKIDQVQWLHKVLRSCG